jgi:serine/threonine protein kinase
MADERTIFYDSPIEYSSPETISEEMMFYASDFWSLGICIFAMFTGKFPFENKESIFNDQLPDMNKIRYLKEEEYKVSDEACQFVMKLLNKDHTKRLVSVDIKMDPFYRGFDWNKLENGLLKPPIKPKLVNILFLTLCFRIII